MNVDLSPRRLAFGFLAAALAVLIFHQGMILALHLAKQTPNFPWSMRPAGPYNVPAIVNSMFWGGLWGVAYAAVGHLIPIAATWLRGLVFGLAGPWLLGNGLLVPLFKSGPYLFGFAAPRMLIGALIASAFGIGLALIFAILNQQGRANRTT